MADPEGPGPTGRSRIVQIHPTLRCNLRCLHCYSSSGPEEREALSLELLGRALEDASSEGYTVVSISGGEPLMYKPLPRLLEWAHACEMLTTVTSNGMLLTERHLAELAPHLDLLALSLDGTPESHNRMRASEHAFTGMAKRLDGVRASGVPFGFIFTLTLHNVHELDWVASFAVEQGASLLQIHPLEEAGRARELLAGRRPDETEASYAFLEAARIRNQYGDRLRVQLDLVHGAALRSCPARSYADDAKSVGAPLADLVSPIVIEANGAVVPLQYGFARLYALGNLHDQSLTALAERWRRDRYQEFRDTCQGAYEELTNKPAFANWYETVAERADENALRAGSRTEGGRRRRRKRGGESIARRETAWMRDTRSANVS